MAKPRVVYAQLEVAHCTVELSLNGVPLIHIAPTPGRVLVENFAIEEFLTPGRNFMELVIEPGETPSVARTGQREISFRPMRAQGRIISCEEGSQVTAKDGRVLASTAIRWAPGTEESRTFPSFAFAEFDNGKGHGRWKWQDAKPMTLTQELIDEARAVMDTYQAFIVAEDSAGLRAFVDIHLSELSRAYPPLTPQYFEGLFDDYLEGLSQFDEPILSREPDEHDFRLVSGGRLLELIDQDWTPSFKRRSGDENRPLGTPMFLGRVGKTLKILR